MLTPASSRAWCRRITVTACRPAPSAKFEVTTYDREQAPRPMVKFNTESVVRIDRLLDRRRTTTREFETLTGRLEALDIGKNEFQLKLNGHRKRVRGTAAFFSLTTLRDYLGATVTLEGEVVRELKSITNDGVSRRRGRRRID